MSFHLFLNQDLPQDLFRKWLKLFSDGCSSKTSILSEMKASEYLVKHEGCQRLINISVRPRKLVDPQLRLYQ